MAERDDMPLVYLYIAKGIAGLKRSLSGFIQAPDGLIRLRGLRFN